MKNSELIFSVKVTPGAKKNEIVGWIDDELTLRIKAAPEKGKANAEVLSFLAKTLKVAKTNLKIVYGLQGRHKRILLTGASLNKLELIKRLSPHEN